VYVEKGPVVNAQGEVIGEHEGVPLYTIGLRHGFRLDKYVGMPVYVVKKDAKTNTVVVGFAKDSEVKEFEVGELSFIRSEYGKEFGVAGDASNSDLGLSHGVELSCFVRIRNLGEKMACKVRKESGVLKVVLDEYTVGVAPGQSAVFYDFEDKGKVLGGGVILDSNISSLF
jgi:tRNA-specific 2-thiouridylase